MPPVEPSERLIGAAGSRLFVRQMGSGPPVVLLHGFPQTGACWHAVAPTLAERHRVLVPDLPGYGKSEMPLAFDAETLSLTVASAIRNAGGAPATIVGHDWGGMIAFRLASHHPDVVSRLVIVNSPYRELNLRRSWHILAFNIPLLPEIAFQATRGGLIDRMLRAGAVHDEVFRGEATAPYRDALSDLGRQRAALAYYRTVSRQTMVRALPWKRRAGGAKRIEVPTMIVWGEEDPALPVSLVDGIARAIPQARVERIPGVGHFVPEEAPERLTELLVDFLNA